MTAKLTIRPRRDAAVVTPQQRAAVLAQADHGVWNDLAVNSDTPRDTPATDAEHAALAASLPRVAW